MCGKPVAEKSKHIQKVLLGDGRVELGLNGRSGSRKWGLDYPLNPKITRIDDVRRLEGEYNPSSTSLKSMRQHYDVRIF